MHIEGEKESTDNANQSRLNYWRLRLRSCRSVAHFKETTEELMHELEEFISLGDCRRWETASDCLQSDCNAD